MEITKEDITKIKELSQDPHIYDMLIKSLVPSIRGYRDIKEAITLSLFQGNTKKINGKVYHGGIKILIIGDHNTGKSTILDTVKNLGITNKFKVIDNVNVSDESSIINLLQSDKSIICAANFKEGNANKYSSLISQVDFSYEFLDCFDLIFLIDDVVSREGDCKLADHVLESHKKESFDYDINSSLLKKYIVYSYVSSKPKLSNEASLVLKEYYVSMRSNNSDNKCNVPITVKHLESLIRLAEASAKIKFKKYVEKEDAEKAVRLQMARLINFGVDPSTDEFDVTLLNCGVSLSDRDTIQYVTEEVKLLEEEFAGDAPLNVLLSNMSEKYGVSEDGTMEILRKLKLKGVLYQPQTGYWRRVM